MLLGFSANCILSTNRQVFQLEFQIRELTISRLLVRYARALKSIYSNASKACLDADTMPHSKMDDKNEYDNNEKANYTLAMRNNFSKLLADFSSFRQRNVVHVGARFLRNVQAGRC